jgi:hypothetical protein
MSHQVRGMPRLAYKTIRENDRLLPIWPPQKPLQAMQLAMDEFASAGLPLHILQNARRRNLASKGRSIS